MTGKLYIVTSSGEYVKNIVPFDKATSLTDGLSHTLLFVPFDTEEVSRFANDKLNKLINNTDSLDWKIEIWNEDTSVLWGHLNLSNTGIEVYTNPTLSEEYARAVRKLGIELGDYVSSIALTLLSRKITGTALPVEDATSASPKTACESKSDSKIDGIVDSIKKNTKADIVKPKETLADYVCDSTLKAELEEIKNFFENESVYKSLGISLPKGILFKGVPGTGKTYAARCIAGSTECWFMSCTASALQGMYIGSGAENIRLVFKGAKALRDASKKGVIVFIDEIDSFGSRSAHSGSSSGEEDRTLNQLLAEMSGFENEDNIMVLAATNYPERLDDALMRSGRFSRQITIERPDEYARRNLIEHYFNKIKLPLNGTDVDEICSLTTSFTPADIQEVANESGILTVRNGEKAITLASINEAVNKVLTKNIRRPDKKDMPRIVAVHEIGHVLAEALYLNSISLKVTNYSYGSAGGFTQPATLMEGIVSQKTFKGYVMALLGGRVAEEIYGTITTGASDDLRRARKYIRAYFETYRFVSYDVKDLEQLVENTLDEWLRELYAKFEHHKAELELLIEDLKHLRILYKIDIAKRISHLITI